MRWSGDGWICRRLLAFNFATAVERSDLSSLFLSFHVPLLHRYFQLCVNTTQMLMLGSASALSVCVCVCVFFFFKEEYVCWFVGVCAFCVCLARSLTEQIKSVLFLRERTEKKEQNNRLSVRKIDSLVIRRYSLQQFLFSFGAWIIGCVILGNSSLGGVMPSV